MSDNATRLESIRAGLERLRQDLSAGGQVEASSRLGVLLAELESLVPPAQRPKTQRRTRRGAASDVEKCPRCTIRSLRPVPDQWRPGADGQSQENLWRCSSCGYEAWYEES